MKVGFTASTFDLLHAGHVAMLREAKSVCDYLICGLQVDPTLDRPKKNQPVQSIVERQAQLAAIKYVGNAILKSFRIVSEKLCRLRPGALGAADPPVIRPLGLKTKEVALVVFLHGQ